jgi:hypothetical protein
MMVVFEGDSNRDDALELLSNLVVILLKRLAVGAVVRVEFDDLDLVHRVLLLDVL